MDFKVGDIVRLKSYLTDRIYDAFRYRYITTDNKLKIYNRTEYNNYNIISLAFEGGWEEDTFSSEYFELAVNRKSRIENLYKNE